MSTHSVAEAKNRLPELIDRALEGEGIVITRHGRPVAELRGIPPQPRPMTRSDLDWLAVLRRAEGEAGPTDAVSFVSAMRDEGEK
ncbi:type II toxin-antitoxin system Phd/YefM family antitoxin [uncultured Enterovirga sp.]|uniref:type II toxin-antitoxin system Phd/YefM family antitoxin n=1 Tax=uncultured Enterovirga sp. TaxID=2026352 RepID=UPI0035CA5481